MQSGGNVDNIKSCLSLAEKCAITFEDRAQITSLYRELAQKNLKDKQFSENIFKNPDFLYSDKPDMAAMAKV